MEEVAGPAAVLVPPGHVDRLAEALDSVLTDPSGGGAGDRRDGVRDRGRTHLGASADAHLDAYRHAAGLPGPPGDDDPAP